MTVHELAKILQDMYENAPNGEQVLRIYLFGIKYHKEIKEVGVKDVIEQSGISSTYQTELSKAVKLGNHVTLK